MTPTDDDLPMRPRGAARRLANDAAAPSISGVAVTTPATPEPSRPARGRRAAPATRTATMTVVRGAVTGFAAPVRRIGVAVGAARTVPLTAAAITACLVVTVSSPQSAVATPADVPVAAVRDAQQLTVRDGFSSTVQRDDFSVGRVRGDAVAATPGPGVGGGAVRPVTGTIPAAGGFGSRWVAGCGACSTSHQGLDFAAPTGTAVVAAMPGRVVSAGVFGGYGNQVLLQHADGSETRYGHLSTIGVRVGQSVAAGERIGAVGSTGVSTGSHLHFEVIVGGVPRDPAAWLGAHGLL